MKEAQKTIEILARELGTDLKSGLTESIAETRLKEHGKNEFSSKKKSNFFSKFCKQLSDKMILILLGAAVISAVSAIILKESFADSIIILAIVFFNALIGVIQEEKAIKAIEALKKLTSPNATVIRDDKEVIISSKDVVVGDIILIKAGDFVPADARIIEANELICDESSLTGEAHPVEKCDCIIKEGTHIGEIRNILFSNTVIQQGYGKALVFATGMDSYIGSIAKMIDENESPQTPLQKKLAQTGTFLGNCALIICAIIFLIGIIQHQDAKEMFLTSVSLAVAAIPEGLPAIVTIVLSLGVQRMAKQNAIVRHLPSVETLGCTSVICSDKTGTITQNKMTVVETKGKLDDLKLFGKLCNNNANPTDKAIFSFSEDTDISGYKRVKEIQFTSDRKIMTVVLYCGNRYLTISKGATDVLAKFSFGADKYKSAIEKMGSNALRVIGIAYKYTNEIPRDIESGLSFAGIYGLLDPPRSEVFEAVSLCKKAGIRPVMITGDHLDTAVAIAKEVGIYNGEAITEKELLALPPKERESIITRASVFARSTPPFKVKIVKALQKNGEIVAMTGDGVNDAPALKSADIGCGMGSGTDVAKNSSDMILTNDNFATIVDAIRYGRIIYDNLRRTIHFLLSCNIGELLTILIAILAGIPSPLGAMQILWVNLVTDSLPAISLGLENGDKNIMQCHPISKKEELLNFSSFSKILIEGIYIGFVSISAFLIGKYHFDSFIIGSTMCFAVLSISQLFHAFNMKSEKPFLLSPPFSNKFLIFSFFICLMLLCLVITIPSVANIFGCCILNKTQWYIVLGLSFSTILFVDIKKLIFKK